jgi:hypothetical protein
MERLQSIDLNISEYTKVFINFFTESVITTAKNGDDKIKKLRKKDSVLKSFIQKHMEI